MTTWLRQLTQRNIILLLLAGQTLLFGAISLALWLEGGLSISTATGLTVALVFVVLTYTYGRGWEAARHVAVVVVTLALALASDTGSFGMSLLIAPVLALILADLWWVAGSAVVVWLGLALRSEGQTLSTANLGVYVAIVGGLLLSRVMLENTLRIARENAAQADEARVAAEADRQQVARSAAELAAQNEQQRQLLDLVTTLEVPAISLAEGVLLAPIVGALDSRRIQLLTARLLEHVSRQRARLVVLDISGVAAVDTTMAKGLVQMAQGLRLLGCNVTITGISAAVASSLSSAGVSLAGVQTTRSPHEALSTLIPTNS